MDAGNFNVCKPMTFQKLWGDIRGGQSYSGGGTVLPGSQTKVKTEEDFLMRGSPVAFD